MTNFEVEVEELRKLARSKPTSKRLRYVENSLASKWEGIQSLALQVLQAWGGRQSVDIIKVFLEASFQRKTSWAVKRVAISALADLVDPQDNSWIEALLKAHQGQIERHELRPLIARVPDLQH